jgi:uncharacterized protein YjeT (DUF2065 family)
MLALILLSSFGFAIVLLGVAINAMSIKDKYRRTGTIIAVVGVIILWVVTLVTTI